MISGIINNRIVFLVIISERKQKEALVAELLDGGARCLNLAYGWGDVEPSYLWDTIGFTAEENNVIISCLLLNEKLDEIFGILLKKFNFGAPDTGIAFTIPIERLSF